jgi:hypothetical protein
MDKWQLPVQLESIKRKCWEAIGELELKLRNYILELYSACWGKSAVLMMKKALGDTSWAVVEENCRRATAGYPYSREKPTLREMDGMYLGQLIQLVIWNKAWGLFEPHLPKKKVLNRWAREVTPVRNDTAHFRDVPEKELYRCWIVCDDFIVCLDRAIEARL